MRTRTAPTSIRARLVAAGTAALLATGIAVAAAAPAQAAAATGEWVTACFVYPNGAVYTGPTFDQVWSSSTGTVQKSFAGSASGCRGVQVPAGSYVRFSAAQQIGTGALSYIWNSYWTGWTYSYGTGYSTNVGTYVANLVHSF